MKYWVAVASREHVQKGVAGGFAQVCHGNAGPLKQMTGGDWIVYYSPTEKFGQKDPCRKWTALGVIGDKDPYPFAMSEGFVPYRRDVQFFAAKEAKIELMIEQLSFIKNKLHWGFIFRRGCFSIEKRDFLLISKAMQVDIAEWEKSTLKL